MFKSSIYKSIIISVSVLLFIFLVEQNYFIKQKITDNQTKLADIDDNKNRDNKFKQFGFTEIIEELNEKDKIKINGLRSQNNKEATVEFEILGDISMVKNSLEDIKKKENFHHVSNIKIYKDENNNNINKVNIDFIKNK